jgi:hypothetical protein
MFQMLRKRYKKGKNRHYFALASGYGCSKLDAYTKNLLIG